jgi:hypothetical protein
MEKKPFVTPTLKEEASLAEVTLFTDPNPCTDPEGCGGT